MSRKIIIPKFMKYDNVSKSRNLRNETTSRKVQSQKIRNKTISGKIIDQNEHIKITCISRKKNFRNFMKLHVNCYISFWCITRLKFLMH